MILINGKLRTLEVELYASGGQSAVYVQRKEPFEKGKTIGLVGETALFLGLPEGHAVLAASVLRFIAFDGAGLVLMAVAFACLLVIGRRVGSLQMQGQMY